MRFETNTVDDVEVKDIMVGTEAQKLRQMLQITYPLDNGELFSSRCLLFLFVSFARFLTTIPRKRYHPQLDGYGIRVGLHF